MNFAEMQYIVSLGSIRELNIMQTFRRLFLDHPATVDESYLEHLVFAFRFSGRLFWIGCAALVHGAVPCAFQTTASTGVLKLSEEIRARRRLAK
jgi:Family of unknown function (DUF6356)